VPILLFLLERCANPRWYTFSIFTHSFHFPYTWYQLNYTSIFNTRLLVNLKSIDKLFNNKNLLNKYILGFEGYKGESVCNCIWVYEKNKSFGTNKNLKGPKKVCTSCYKGPAMALPRKVCTHWKLIESIIGIRKFNHKILKLGMGYYC
jgi:hypothetical protein